MEEIKKYIMPESAASRCCGESSLLSGKGLPTFGVPGVKTKTVAVTKKFSSRSAWIFNWNNGNTNNNSKNNNNRVRPVSASPVMNNSHADKCREEIPLEDIFAAYYGCRKNKRNTRSAMVFEVNYEQNCVELWKEVNEHRYVPQNSVTFIVTRPVIREVFAADFRDRVIHHLLASRLNPLLEELFTENTSCCRKGKGTHYGIKKLDEAIRECSCGYTADCWVLTLDVKSYFMSIDKCMLMDMWEEFIELRYQGNDKRTLLFLLRTVIMNDPTKGCEKRSSESLWKKLPTDKSLFSCGDGRGLPIGDWTSQMSANFLLNGLDHWLSGEFEFTGRYMDDFHIVSTQLEKMKRFVPLISEKMKYIGLTLHPKKIHLQHYSKGVKYIGAVIKPGRIYVSNRTRNNFLRTIHRFNRRAEKEEDISSLAADFQASINSYLGLCRHFNTYGLRRRYMKVVNPRLWEACYISGHFEKIVIKKKYRKTA